MVRNGCRKCGKSGTAAGIRSSGLCAECDNHRVKVYNRKKRASEEARAEYNAYMRDLRSSRKKRGK